MKTTIICTVGTSTLEKIKLKNLHWIKGTNKSNPVFYNGVVNKKFELLDSLCKRYTFNRMKAIEPRISFEPYLRDISNLYITELAKEHWENWDGNNNISRWRLCPAEVASTLRLIQKLELDPENTEIVLAISDTGHSYVSAIIIQSIFTKLGFTIKEENMREIEGFQMEDIERFSSLGLPNFVQTINEYMTDEEKSNEKQIFNITGGYKNFIPLVTHIASFHRKDMYYVFEEAAASKENSLVKIPKIPTLNRLFTSDKEDTNIMNLILNKIDKTGYTDIDEALEEIDRILSIKLSINKFILKEYLQFIEDFLVVNDQKVELSMIGKVYLILFNKGLTYEMGNK
ncbi:hypothetical protein CIB95_12550 [Lottiidibacillus patelloidae]|uniref:CRISPR system ring nuclease SSO1393-like domain-containing protein n=1 Tax=Lottiidibacillus patelloidae TaxID=2670334 RepID=A0A263BS97_9BACI|nr:hypothetical protein [Lottiidibacillus patelloidae]OZM56247.1 hypothetical protein CIB95_12550 [Lottiidibacillus patelloidae]